MKGPIELSMTMLKSAGHSISFEDEWPKTRPMILKLLKQEKVTQPEWQDLFWQVHNICSWDENGAKKIYRSLQQDILDFVKSAQERVLSDHDDTTLLRAYITEWGKFFAQCDYLPRLFHVLESSLNSKPGGATAVTKKASPDDSEVRKLMLESWNSSIFSEVKDRLQESAMKLVHAERVGEAFDAHLVIGVRESYVSLSCEQDDKLKIYRDNFERAYLEATHAFYKVKAHQYLSENGVQCYMSFAEAKLLEEEERARRYLETRKDIDSVAKLVKCCVEVLVTEFKETILSECSEMICQNETKKLQLMFCLMDRVPDGVLPMLHCLQQHIKNAGLAAMHAAADVITADSEKYVEHLLSLFNSFSDLVRDAFCNDARFLTARDMAYKFLVNDTSVFKLELTSKSKGVATSAKVQPESKCPELLANYCDMLLRRTALSKRLASEQVERKLTDALLVLKYVQNKDVFMRFHKAHLTRRLIVESSADNETEESTVERLREIGMPAEYVNKLARMFQDIKVSQDLNQEFKDALRNNNESMADLVNIKVLNAGAWARSSERVPVSMPAELEDFIPSVEDFYRSKHSGRKLQWNYLMSNGVINFANETGKFELEVTTFQMAVLFAWNERPSGQLSFEGLRLATQLPDSEMRRTLWSLVAFPKLRKQVLCYSPEVGNAKDFADTTVFWVNQNFCLMKNGKPQKRGRINLIGRLQLSTDKSNEEDTEGIMQLRILRVQEAVVKIMKTRKRMSNAALQTELVEILKYMFLPSKKLIKEQIEWLIENKYICRDTENMNTFVYMA